MFKNYYNSKRNLIHKKSYIFLKENRSKIEMYYKEIITVMNFKV